MNDNIRPKTMKRITTLELAQKFVDGDCIKIDTQDDELVFSKR